MHLTWDVHSWNSDLPSTLNSAALMSLSHIGRLCKQADYLPMHCSLCSGVQRPS